ncbi:hypothetical protein, partial [Klebsiella pneumoniae]|uniref:hypothetical protein n=1 Tax=Klebsiella pneumoniae TaxID=573 RepID=UPI003012D53B
IFTTRGTLPKATAQTGLIVREEFSAKYPQTIERIVKVLVQADRWASDDANRAEALTYWSTIFDSQKFSAEDYSDRPLADRASPL